MSDKLPGGDLQQQPGAKLTPKIESGSQPGSPPVAGVAVSGSQLPPAEPVVSPGSQTPLPAPPVSPGSQSPVPGQQSTSPSSTQPTANVGNSDNSDNKDKPKGSSPNYQDKYQNFENAVPGDDIGTGIAKSIKNLFALFNNYRYFYSRINKQTAKNLEITATTGTTPSDTLAIGAPTTGSTSPQLQEPGAQPSPVANGVTVQSNALGNLSGNGNPSNSSSVPPATVSGSPQLQQSQPLADLAAYSAAPELRRQATSMGLSSTEIRSNQAPATGAAKTPAPKPGGLI
jgi:hypothetical protein